MCPLVTSHPKEYLDLLGHFNPDRKEGRSLNETLSSPVLCEKRCLARGEKHSKKSSIWLWERRV